ncbi:MAG TPA: LPS export ABC transporter periplasmic protein LptC [Burkholderiales bacterium]|nr:LPS export ABC transporter periplasmic protein LptC [Burkholderiales bacterium]
MTDRLGAWFPLVLLAALAALTFWLDQVTHPRDRAQSGVVKHDPDYIVEGLSARRMDHVGRVKHTLLARKMTHYPDDDMTLLVEPKFVTYAEGRAPVSVTSRQARVSGNGEHVYFEDNVRVVRAPHGNDSELTVETNYLHVIPDENLARTDRPVTIRNAAIVIAASGLELNSETRVLKLQGRVRGTFVRAAPANAH